MDAEMRELQKTQDALDAWIADQNAQEEVRKGNDALIQIAGWTGVILIVMAYLK
jgi:hypothetical protein